MINKYNSDNCNCEKCNCDNCYNNNKINNNNTEKLSLDSINGIYKNTLNNLYKELDVHTKEELQEKLTVTTMFQLIQKRAELKYQLSYNGKYKFTIEFQYRNTVKTDYIYVNDITSLNYCLLYLVQILYSKNINDLY